MDLSKLKTSDWLVGGGTIVFLIAMFLPWYEVDIGFASGSENGWNYFFFGIIPLLLLIAVSVFLVGPKLSEGMNLPDTVGPLPRAQATLIGAGVATVIVLLRLIFKDDFGGGDEAEDFIDRGIGLFLAFIAAAATTAGAFLKYSGKDEGSSSSSAPPTPF